MKIKIAAVIVLALFNIACGGCDDDTPDGADLRFEDAVFEDCTDGEDNDDDGFVDCDDTQCHTNDSCRFVPAQPSSRAPAPTAQTATSFWESIRFLVEGDDPIVRGVDVDRLQKERVAVVRASIIDRDGNPLPGVRSYVAGAPKFGYTFSRSDGAVDFVVDTNQEVVIRFDDQDVLGIDARVKPIASDFSTGATVVATELDSVTSEVSGDATLTSSSVVVDDDGSRSLRVFFNEGTTADAELDDGRLARLETFTLRATEFTTGDRGLEAMPGVLPDASAYTYAVELSVDELREVGVENVRFNQPVFLYLDNFLEFPVGSIVPSGFYDRSNTQSWIPSPNGVVIERVDGGFDIDGDGAANGVGELQQIGFTDAEVAALSTAYPPGKSLWRVPVTHFTPWDLNWPIDFPDGAVGLSPDKPPYFLLRPPSKPCRESGSIIECESQTLTKSFPVPGTDMSIWYRSDRVPGRGRGLTVQISGPEALPDSLKRIEAEIAVAGRSFNRTFEAERNQTWEFDWDGLDAYGREVNREVAVTVRVNYIYDTTYVVPAEDQRAFSQPGLDQILADARVEQPLTQTFVGKLGALDAKSVFGLGGWMLDVSTFYDGGSGTLYVPDRAAQNEEVADVSRRIRTYGEFAVDGTTIQGHSKLQTILTDASDNSYLVETTASLSNRVHRVNSDGSVELIAGGSYTQDSRSDSCFEGGAGGNSDCGEGGPVDEFRFFGTTAISDSGSIFNAHLDCIRTFAPEALTYRKFAGNCISPTPGSNQWFNAIAVCGEDVFVVDGQAIRKFSEGDSTGELIAGNENNLSTGDYDPTNVDGVDAQGAVLGDIFRVGCAPDGELFWLDQLGSILTINDGTIDVYWANTDPAISPVSLHDSSDGGPYVTARDLQGTYLFKADRNQLKHIAGTSRENLTHEEIVRRSTEDDIPAVDTIFSDLFAVSETSDASLLIADRPIETDFVARIRIISDALSSQGGAALVSPSGNALMIVSTAGLPLRNVSTRTGDLNYELEYDANGFLETIRRFDGLEAKVERDANGDLTAIVGYFGVRTTFETDENGYLTAFNYANGTSQRFEYEPDGLLTLHANQTGAETTYEYDATGGLGRVDRPDGTSKTFVREGDVVTMETSSGRIVRYATGGGREVTDAAGHVWSTTESDGTSVTMHPDGAVVRVTSSSDPRFGAQASFTSRHEIEQPSGLLQVFEVKREATLTDSSDPMSIETTTDTLTRNGEPWTIHYDADARTVTRTSPVGRTVVDTLDDAGRTKTVQYGSLSPTTFEWGAGVLNRVQMETMRADFTYDTRGYLQSTSTADRTLAFETDELGHVERQIGNNTHELEFNLSPYGAVSEIIADQTWMTFQYDGLGRMTDSTLSDGANTHVTYNEVGDISTMSQPSVPMTSLFYDDAQRLIRIEDDLETHTFAYDAATGQIAEVNTPSVRQQFGYDGSLRTSFRTTVGGVTAEVSRTYDDAFAVRSRTIDGERVDYAFDADGLLTKAGQATLSWRSDVALLETRTVGGVQVTHTYNGLGRRTSSDWVGPAGFRFTESVDVDESLRITSQQESGASTGSKTFTYDDGSRLASVTDGGSTEAFTYDTIGNRLSADGITQTYDAAGRLRSVGGRTYSFDAAGRIAYRNNGTRARFSFTGLNRMRSFTSTAILTYGYDAMGNRVSKSRNGTLETVWLYDNGVRPLAQLDGAGNVEQRYVYAEQASVPAYAEINGRTYAYVTDYLGSVRFVVDAQDGTIVQELDYDVWGKVIRNTNPGFQPFGFAGGMLDPETGFYRMGSRDYDPVSGRFTTPDPTGLAAGEPNLWLYVSNMPSTAVDPTGEFWVAVAGGAVVVAGGGYVLNVSSTAHSSSGDAAEILDNVGTHNGPGDAVRHCTMNCRMTRKHGVAVARLASEYHETPWIPTDLKGGGLNNIEGNPERVMDEFNNDCGQHIAQTQEADKSCLRGCEEALRGGRLKTLNPKHWFDGATVTEQRHFGSWLNSPIRSPWKRADLQ